MIEPHVRPGRPDDVDDLERLEREARRHLVDARGGARWLELHPLVGARWAERVEAGEVVVAELRVPGLAPCVVGFLEWSGAEVVRVEQVYVEPGARQLGFGDALLDAALERARSGGARLLEAEALPGDRDTKNLYERAGITARLLTMSVRLTGS